jgi:hypothetical protein
VENMVDPDRPHDNIIRRMRSACWVTKAIDTTYVILIAFAWQNNGYANEPQCYVSRYIACLLEVIDICIEE